MEATTSVLATNSTYLPHSRTDYDRKWCLVAYQPQRPALCGSPGRENPPWDSPSHRHGLVTPGLPPVWCSYKSLCPCLLRLLRGLSGTASGPWARRSAAGLGAPTPFRVTEHAIVAGSTPCRVSILLFPNFVIHHDCIVLSPNELVMQNCSYRGKRSEVAPERPRLPALLGRSSLTCVRESSWLARAPGGRRIVPPRLLSKFARYRILSLPRFDATKCPGVSSIHTMRNGAVRLNAFSMIRKRKIVEFCLKNLGDSIISVFIRMNTIKSQLRIS